VTLADITRSSTLSALAEFDHHLGRDAFLARYGFGEARRYFLVHEGRTYD
jgi:5-methylcytosine-specific restriction protein A